MASKGNPQGRVTEPICFPEAPKRCLSHGRMGAFSAPTLRVHKKCSRSAEIYASVGVTGFDTTRCDCYSRNSPRQAWPAPEDPAAGLFQPAIEREIIHERLKPAVVRIQFAIATQMARSRRAQPHGFRQYSNGNSDLPNPGSCRPNSVV